MYSYRCAQWLLFFYIYCFIGWVFETTYVSIKKKRFVNRGFLRAPLLPIYGTGAIVMLWATMPVKDSLILTWLVGAVSATVLEYVVGICMEALFKVKYWDYSNQKFNFQGIICLSSTIAWGFLTLLLTRVIHRPIEEWVMGLPDLALGMITGGVSSIFVLDTIVSVRAALDLRKMLEGMTRIRAELEAMQVQLSLAKMETMAQVEGLKENWESQKQKLLAAGERLGNWLTELGVPTKEQIDELKELLPDYSALVDKLKDKAAEYNRIVGRMGFFKAGLLKRNPGARSEKFSQALSELQKRIIDHINGYDDIKDREDDGQNE